MDLRERGSFRLRDIDRFLERFRAVLDILFHQHLIFRRALHVVPIEFRDGDLSAAFALGLASCGAAGFCAQPLFGIVAVAVAVAVFVGLLVLVAVRVSVGVMVLVAVRVIVAVLVAVLLGVGVDIAGAYFATRFTDVFALLQSRLPQSFVKYPPAYTPNDLTTASLENC